MIDILEDTHGILVTNIVAVVAAAGAAGGSLGTNMIEDTSEAIGHVLGLETRLEKWIVEMQAVFSGIGHSQSNMLMTSEEITNLVQKWSLAR